MARIPGTTFHDSDPPKPKEMSDDQCFRILKSYRVLLEERGRKPIRNSAAKERESQEDHLLWMCEETTSFIKNGRREKAMRWLGFIQGTFWALGIRTIDSMKDDNR